MRIYRHAIWSKGWAYVGVHLQEQEVKTFETLKSSLPSR